ncbi:hypothetical protein HXX76_012374 [Chlamydomonas incerta]|uniref:LysM domain-containing protein n=1 Tax=Chlamydomonas incerta TaxID=51695 RepID=A0A835VVJ4_CHLIN|nr:hypothetical protein HXX76_012374 [Chlamydomonas incerta]|eukprot:KAG2427438.1 hypothetical protein HXX76_012374 [Chlamydomonas incerta]
MELAEPHSIAADIQSAAEAAANSLARFMSALAKSSQLMASWVQEREALYSRQRLLEQSYQPSMASAQDAQALAAEGRVRIEQLKSQALELQAAADAARAGLESAQREAAGATEQLEQQRQAAVAERQHAQAAAGAAAAEADPPDGGGDGQAGAGVMGTAGGGRRGSTAGAIAVKQEPVCARRLSRVAVKQDPFEQLEGYVGPAGPAGWDQGQAAAGPAAEAPASVPRCRGGGAACGDGASWCVAEGTWVVEDGSHRHAPLPAGEEAGDDGGSAAHAAGGDQGRQAEAEAPQDSDLTQEEDLTQEPGSQGGLAGSPPPPPPQQQQQRYPDPHQYPLQQQPQPHPHHGGPQHPQAHDAPQHPQSVPTARGLTPGPQWGAGRGGRSCGRPRPRRCRQRRRGKARYGSVKPPQVLDWRKNGVMSPPGNQNPCGACWSYAVAHGVEAAVNIGRVSAGGSAVSLAEMQPVVCSAEVSGNASQPRCKDGWVGKAYRYAAEYGFVPQQLWSKWTAGAYVEAQTCPAQVLSNSTAFTDVADTITGWETAPSTPLALKKVVANQPAVVLVHASPDWQTYAGGLFNGSCSADIADANHAVLVVGWTQDAWIVKNSWGADWGEGGYMLLPQQNRSICGILNSITYPVFEPVRPDRQGEVLRQGFCAGIGRVELGSAAASLRSLSILLNVTLDGLMRGGPDAAIEPLTKYFIPPCSRDVPPPPVPKTSCGTTYSIFAAAEPASSSSGAGSRRRRALAAQLGGADGWDGGGYEYAIQDGFQLHPHGVEAQRRHLEEQQLQAEEALARVLTRLQDRAAARRRSRSLLSTSDFAPPPDSSDYAPPPPAISCPWANGRASFGGSYSGSCSGCFVSPSTCVMSCNCRNAAGSSVPTILHLDTCASGLADNVNGKLVCRDVVTPTTLAPSPRPPSPFPPRSPPPPPPPSPAPAAAIPAPSPRPPSPSPPGPSTTASPSPALSPSPAPNKNPPMDCGMPSSWCRNSSFTLVKADCDGDGGDDWPPPAPPPAPQPPPLPPPAPSPPSGTEGLAQRFPTDYAALVANISAHRYPRAGGGADASAQPTQLLLLGSSFPVLLSPDGRPLVGAAAYGAGRVVVVGDASLVSDIRRGFEWAWTRAPSFRVINNALGWLAGLGRPLARGDALNEVAVWAGGLGADQAEGLRSYLRENGWNPSATSPSFTSATRRYDAAARPDARGPLSFERLSGYRVLILTTSELLSASFTADLQRYVREGGALLVLRTSAVKPFPSTRPNVTFANVYSCNRLLGPMGLLVTGSAVEPVPSWRPDVAVPAAASPDMLLSNAEYAAELLKRHWAGQARGASRLSVEAYEKAVASMEFAKKLLTPSASLFPSFFNLLASVRGPPPPPALTAARGSSTSSSDGSSTRLGPLFTYWLTSPALEIIEERLEDWSAGCPEGSVVTGFEGMAWSTRDARPWGATRGGMFTTELRLQCGDGSLVDTGYATAPDKYATATLPMMRAGTMGVADINIGNQPMFGVSWAEPPCAGGYDAVRARAHSGDESNYVAPIQLFFRCRDTQAWTTYTAGIGLVAVKLDGQQAQATFRGQTADAGRNPSWYINGRAPLVYRSAEALAQLQALAQLEDTAAVYCPPGQAIAGLSGLRWVPPVSDFSDAVSADPYLHPDLRVISWQPSYSAIRNTDIRMNPGYTVMLSAHDVICRPAPPTARDASSTTADPAVSPTQLERAIAAAPYSSVYMLTVAAPPSASPDTNQPPQQENATLLTCGEGALITAVMAASDSALELNYVAVRCNDGKSVSVGAFNPKSQDSSFVDNPCQLGYDAVRPIGGRVQGGSGSGLGGFAVRCASPIPEDSSRASSPWTRFGGPVLSRVGPWADRFALTEAATNAPVVECPERQRVSALRVVTVKGVVSAIDFYCAPLPPPPKDYSFLDIAARYGITLSDLFNANPQLDRARPVLAYNGSVIAIPQLCGVPPIQPPVSTIAAGCSRWWPFPNITVTGAETCGSVSMSLRLALPYLNQVNDNKCPNAATAVAKGTRLCVAPPAAVTSVGRRRRGLLQSSSSDCAQPYSVAVGDFCDFIASSAGVDVADLLDWNTDLDCANLQVGAVICVLKGLPRNELLAHALAPPSPPSPPSPPPQPPSPPPRPPALPAGRWATQQTAAAGAVASPAPKVASPPPSPRPPSPRTRPPRPPVLTSPSPPRRAPSPLPPPALPRPPAPPTPPSPPSPPRLPSFPPRAPRRTYDASTTCNATLCGPAPNRCVPSNSFPAGYTCNCSSGYVASDDGATCLPLLNVALRKAVFASSTLPADPEIRFQPRWAVDGNLSATLPNTAGYFSSARGDAVPFLTIDLGAPYALSHLVINTRPGYARRLTGAVVRVGFAAVRGEPDRAALATNPACWQQAGGAAAADRIEVRCDASGQWVTIVNTGGALLQLAEVEVYAIRQLASCPDGTVPAVQGGGCSALAPPPPPQPPSPRRPPPAPRPPAASLPAPRLGNGTCASAPCGPAPNTCQNMPGGLYNCTCGEGYGRSGSSPLTCSSLTANLAAGRWLDWYTSSYPAAESGPRIDLYNCLEPGDTAFALQYEDLTDGKADPAARTQLYIPREEDHAAPWVSMDLGKPYLVRRIVLATGGADLRCLTLFVKTYDNINKTFGGFALMQNTVFRVGALPVLWNDRGNYQQLDARGLTGNAVCYVQTEAVAAGSRLVATCDPPLVGQYVSVQQNTIVGNELIALTEFEVYGTPAVQCPAGYTPSADGASCEDTNECQALAEPCGRFPNKCINLQGSYACSCGGGAVLYQNTTGPTCVPRGIVPWTNADPVFESGPGGAISGYKDSVVFASSAFTLPFEKPFVNDGRGRDWAFGPYLAFNGIASGAGWRGGNSGPNYNSKFAWSDWTYKNGPFMDSWRSADGDAKPWLSIFLTQTFVVTSVTLYNVPANLSDYLVNVEVRVGGVGVGSVNATGLIPENELCGAVAVAADAGEAVTVTCRRPLAGRWVSVQKVAPAVRTAESSPAFNASLASTLVLAEVEVRGYLAPKCPLGQVHDPAASAALNGACVPAKPRPVRFLDVRAFERAGGGHAFLRTNDNVFTGYVQDITWRNRYDYGGSIVPYYPVAVCGDGWNSVAAAAFCRALGKAGGTASSLDKPNSWSGEGELGYGINNVTCATAATAFGDCTMVPVDARDCATFAGVTCT